MKQLRWTKADEKRAKAMGWFLEQWTPRASDGEPFTYYGIQPLPSGRFETQREAIDSVLHLFRFHPHDLTDVGRRDHGTCVKAVLLCCHGGAL